MKLLSSTSSNVRQNLTLEEYLLTRTADEILLFYINSPAVVLGRNQKTEAETDLLYCMENTIEVARRISGGGAVYHDEGNLNWAFIGNVKEGRMLDEKPLHTMIGALASLGVDAVAGTRGELLVRGLKISGTASCIRKGRRLFHGTLLHCTDLTKMSRALSGDPTVRGAGVASVPSPVMNLSSLPGLDVPTEQFRDYIISYFEALCGIRAESIGSDTIHNG